MGFCKTARWLSLAILALSAGTASGESSIAARGESHAPSETLRVGSSGDYPPFSERMPDGSVRGFSADIARRYASDRGLALEFVPFAWPELLSSLAADRFDLVLSGVTIRPERSMAGKFSLPLMETGAVVLMPKDDWGGIDGLDQLVVRIGVNAGGHLERVAAKRFPRASRIAIPDNAAVLQALINGAVNAVVTDTVEAPRWLAELPPGYESYGPFTRDRKAALVAPARSALALDFDAWLLEREQDGTLAALRTEHFGTGDWPATARPLSALLAAVDERLSLMPSVAFVKRRTGVPLEVPEREEFVLEAAGEAVRVAAVDRTAEPPDKTLVQEFFRAQMEAAKAVQRKTVRGDFELPEPLPDLNEMLRPALLRIGERSAFLLTHLGEPPQAVDPGEGSIATLVDAEIRSPSVSPSSRREISKAIDALLKDAANRREAAATANTATEAP